MGWSDDDDDDNNNNNDWDNRDDDDDRNDGWGGRDDDDDDHDGRNSDHDGFQDRDHDGIDDDEERGHGSGHGGFGNDDDDDDEDDRRGHGGRDNDSDNDRFGGGRGTNDGFGAGGAGDPREGYVGTVGAPTNDQPDFERTIYCAGAFNGNQSRPRAGVGVYIVNDDSENYSAPVRDGAPSQERADLLAIERGLDDILDETNLSLRYRLETTSAEAQQQIVKNARQLEQSGWRVANSDVIKSCYNKFQQIYTEYDRRGWNRFEIVPVNAYSGSAGITQAVILAKEAAGMDTSQNYSQGGQQGYQNRQDYQNRQGGQGFNQNFNGSNQGRRTQPDGQPDDTPSCCCVVM